MALAVKDTQSSVYFHATTELRKERETRKREKMSTSGKVRREKLQKTWRKNPGEKRMRMDGDV